MKSSDNFRIDQAWWHKNKPITLKSTGLGAVMKKYQDAVKKIQELAKKGKYTNEFSGSVTPFDEATAILKKELPAAITKAKSMCKPAMLFKDTIAVLDKHPAVLNNEAQNLTNLETQFNKTYKTTHFDPIFGEAFSLHDNLKKEKNSSEILFKEAEAAHKRVTGHMTHLQKLQNEDKLQPKDITKAEDESKKDMDRIKVICKDLGSKLSSAEEDLKTAGKIDAKIKGILSFPDQHEVRTHVNAVNKLKNLILDFRNRAEMYQTGAHSARAEFKGVLNNAKVSDEKHLKELKELQTKMTNNEGSTRKLENAFTNILPQLTKMINAIKNAPVRAEIQVPDGVNTPVNKWEEQVAKWLKMAEQAKTKSAEVLKQSEEVRDKVLEQIPDNIKKTNQGIVDDINAKCGGIKTYQNMCVADHKRFETALNSIRSELSKKA